MSRTALITGASGGIGCELAKLFARDGYNLVLVARSEAKLAAIQKGLQKAYPITVTVLAKDLIDPSAPQEIYDTLMSQGITVDALVNNAGFGMFGAFSGTDWHKEYAMIELNIAALVHMTKLFVKDMLPRKRGKILNLSSIAAFEPGPLMSVYYASKAFVLSFSEALAEELRGSGITVTALCPGPTNTGFAGAAALHDSEFASSFQKVSAKQVAVYGYKAMRQGKAVAIHGTKNKLTAFAVRLVPRSLVRRVVHSIQSK